MSNVVMVANILKDLLVSMFPPINRLKRKGAIENTQRKEFLGKIKQDGCQTF
jgi:hypothetical protein